MSYPYCSDLDFMLFYCYQKIALQNVDTDMKDVKKH